MTETNTSILLELNDKLSQQLANLQKAFEVTTTKGKELANSAYNISKSFLTAGEELEKFRDNVNNTSNSYKELIKIISSPASTSKLTKFLKTNLNEAANRQEVSFDVGTVLKGGNTKGIEEVANKLADNGLTTFNNAMKTSYDLLSTGVSEEETQLATDIASKVAAFTKGNASEIGSIMVKTAKDFHLSIQQTGDILAKTQDVFHIKNFNQLEEGLKYIAASANSLNIPLSQSAALIGTLSAAGQKGSIAGTGTASILNSLTKASDELNIAIPKAKNGSLDMVKWISLVQDKLQGDFGDDKLAKRDAIIKLFGNEGAQSFQILVDRSKELQEKFGELDNSKGFVNDKTIEYMQLLNTQVKALHNSFSHLEDSLGKVTLKPLTGIVSIISGIISWLANLTARSQALTWIIDGVTIALVGLYYGSLFLEKLTIINRIFSLSQAFYFLRTAISLTTMVTRALSLAMIANPMGALIWLLASGAILIIANWDKVKQWFTNFIAWFKESEIFEIMQKGIDFVKGMFDNNSVIINNESVNKVKEASVVGNTTTAHNTNNNQTYNINVNGAQQPIDTAKEMNRELEKAEQLSMSGG